MVVEENKIVTDQLKNSLQMGVNMLLKINFLQSHLSFFSENVGSIEKRHQGFWNEHMLG